MGKEKYFIILKGIIIKWEESLELRGKEESREVPIPSVLNTESEDQNIELWISPKERDISEELLERFCTTPVEELPSTRLTSEIHTNINTISNYSSPPKEHILDNSSIAEPKLLSKSETYSQLTPSQKVPLFVT